MKVNVNADGTVELDVAQGEGQTALDLINALQAQAREREQLKTDVTERNSRTVQAKAERTGLTLHQYATWEYLCENDSVAGIHVSTLAKDFGINNGAANARLAELLKMGYAKRARRGYYRAETPTNGGVQH